ncbi:MAG: virulence protein RhuM/Fic/DOC family protein [Candidatus Omnitrophica bacterium]|nr:virulence protein RhuM/Fic/DOC family protein [Candidatus Omnitrophota bacterium]
MGKINNAPRGEITIYQTKDKKVKLEVKIQQETTWLNLNQMVILFGRDKSVISRHLRNVFKTKELTRHSVVAKFATTGADRKVYQVDYYTLDAILSVGYRVNSKRGAQFRIWATNVLKRHLIDGYTLNERRLKEKAGKLEALQKSIKLISTIKTHKELDYKEAMGLLDVISDYSYGLGLLDEYDNKKLKITKTTSEEKFRLDYDGAIKTVEELKKRFGASSIFGKEKDKSFRGSIDTIYQTFDNKELYPSVEEKAANLLYFIVKNHSFVDGNKRIAASIFLWFLEKNKILYRDDGSKRLADNALVALTLMIAESNPSERDIISKLVVNLINRDN